MESEASFNEDPSRTRGSSLAIAAETQDAFASMNRGWLDQSGT